MPRPDGLTARRRAVGAALLTALVAGMAILSSRSPDTLPIPACPFRAVTGLLCPFCGSTRAAHELLNGDLERAVALNPLGTLFLPVALGFVLWVLVVPLIRARPVRTVKPPRWLGWAGTGVLTAVWVLRNVPGAWPLPIAA